MSWKLSEIYEALNKKFENTKDLKLNRISIDSRKINKNDFFIPISGKSFDGHDFIDEVSNLGVKACLVEKNKRSLIKNKKIHKIFVDDTHKSLEKLAIYSRNKIKNLIMICITGSTGKTSLKEWLGIILGKKFKTHVNPGNYNNHIGMPLSLINMPLNTEVCVLELGMNKFGEIKKLAKISKPTISIITNIGSAHIGNFNQQKDIAEEKSDIFCFLTKASYAVVPHESKYYEKLFQKASIKTNKIISFGTKFNSDAKYEYLNKDKYLFSILNKEIILKKNNFFQHWEKNILIVLAILKILDLKFSVFKDYLEKLKPLKGRGESTKIHFKKKTFFLIDESYNSSPQSLEKAIINASKLANNSKLILVIGDMLELGKYSKELHLKIHKTVKRISPSIIFTVGEFSELISKKLPSKIMTQHFKSFDNVYERLIEEIGHNDIVMIKGSNSINLSRICEKLKKK